ncbi:MAG TPA: hypothetical protein ENI44_05355, partial [Thermoplasmatales archaeon]|nr:hypothetical protein [Thermoplasmatales archaeon]
MGNVTITVSDPSEDYGIKLTDDHISLGHIRLNVSVGYRGIWLDYVSNCRIFNVTVNINSTEGDTRDGIYLDNSQDNIIENTSVNSQGFQFMGIYNYYSDGTIIRNNTVYVNGDSADGIMVFSSYASVIGNTINISGISSSEGYGVYLYLPYNSTIENNIIMINLSESNSWNAYFIGGSDCIFRDNILSGVNVSIDRLDEDIIKIRGVPRDQWPSNPEEHVNISIFLDISMESNNWLILNITYNESELPPELINELTLKIWRYSEDWEEDGWNGTRFLDIVNNTVGVNITTSGIFAPLGETEDVTPPVLTILNPSENNSIFNTSWVNISIRSNEDLNNAVLWWNGTNYTMSGGGKNWYYNMTGLDDGNYTYRVYGVDTAGNQNSTLLYTLMTDTIKPIYSNISQDKNNVLPGECVNVSVLWRDENLAYAWLMTNQSFDGVSYWHRVETIKLLDKQNWSNFTITPSVDDIGHIIGWKVYANDTAGNTNITPISNINVRQPLYIIDWKPIAENISDNVGDSREFNITLNQRANITWYINGSIVKTDDNVNFSSYLNSSAPEGYWNVTAYA